MLSVGEPDNMLAFVTLDEVGACQLESNFNNHHTQPRTTSTNSALNC